MASEKEMEENSIKEEAMETSNSTMEEEKIEPYIESDPEYEKEMIKFAQIVDKKLGNPSKKKKKVEISTFGGGSGPGHFPHFKKKEKEVVIKMHSKPF